MLDKSEKNKNSKTPLNLLQKAGFWLLVGSIILGISYVYIEYLKIKSWDSYWEVASEIDNEILNYILVNDIYLIFILLGFMFLYSTNKKSLKAYSISAIVTSILVFDRILLYFGVWDENSNYWNYSFMISIVFYLFLGVIIWNYYNKATKNKIPKYLFLYGVVSFLLLIINANIISLGIIGNIFSFIYFSGMLAMIVAVTVELNFLIKHNIIINTNIRREKMSTYENRVANIILTTGKIYIIGSVIGAFFLLGFLEDFDAAMKYTIVIMSLGYSFLFSLIFFGAAEVIELLQKQNKNMEEMIRIQKNSSQPIKIAEEKPAPDNFVNLPEL